MINRITNHPIVQCILTLLRRYCGRTALASILTIGGFLSHTSNALSLYAFIDEHFLKISKPEPVSIISNKFVQICDTKLLPPPKDKLLKECQDAVLNKDYEKLRFLADKGLSSAAAEYGMYLRVNKSYEDAHRYITQAANNNSNLGKYLLGIAYYSGIPPLLEDRERGIKLISEAANNGHKDAVNFLKEIIG